MAVLSNRLKNKFNLFYRLGLELKHFQHIVLTIFGEPQVEQGLMSA